MTTIDNSKSVPAGAAVPNSNPWRGLGPWILFAVVLAIAPMAFDSSFGLTVLSRMGVFIIFAIAYNMLLGQGGMLSFGHAVYFGMAGYFTIHLIGMMQDEAVPYYPISLLPLFGGLVGLVIGALIGFVSTRRAGTTFAMISLGFGEMFTALTLVLVAFFNGEEGIQGDRWVGPEYTFNLPFNEAPLELTFGPAVQVYYLIAIWTVIAAATMYFLTRTPFGRISNAVRDNPERAEFVGYNTQRVRWLAFALSSFFAGLAGALYAVNYEHVGFETVSGLTSAQVLIMVYIGGISSFLGPIIGAVLIVLLDAVLADYTEAWTLYLGTIFVCTVLFAPRGLAGLIMMHQPIWKIDFGLLKGLVLPYAMAIGSTIVACVGVIGLFEMAHHLQQDIVVDPEMILFWITVNPHDVMPWVGFGVTALVGVYFCTKAYKVARKAWDRTVASARAAVASMEASS